MYDGPLDESAEELYENAPCGYLSTLPDGVVLRVNQTFLGWTGYTREELLLGRRFQELLTVVGQIFYETHFAPLLAMQGDVSEVAFDLRRADGSTMPALVNAIQKTDRGRPALIRIMVFNATDRRQYERELLLARRKAEEASKAKSDLLSMLSHDIRNPLSAMLTGLQMLERTGLGPQQAQLTRIVRTSADTLLDLVNNILDISKIEAGAISLESHRFDLRVLVEHTRDGLVARAEEKGLPVHVVVDERVPAALVGDPVKLGQILANLLGNAIKFTEQGEVRLTVTLREEQASHVLLDFEVADTGIGISPEQQALIFGEYAQASYEVGAAYGGSGLGLSITRKLLKLHGSRITVESTPGRGSTFRFQLCLNRPGDEASG